MKKVLAVIDVPNWAMHNRVLALKKFLTDKYIFDTKLYSEISSKEVLKFAVQIFRKLGFERVRIWLIDDEKKELYGGKASHIPDRIFKKVCMKFNIKNKVPGFKKAISLSLPCKIEKSNSNTEKISLSG